MKQTFASIEGLRGWMAWWVVVAHALQLGGWPAWVPSGIVNLLMRADVAVNVFIIVSGFVITHLLLAKQEPYPAYLIRRFFRIAPIYYLCLALAIVVHPYYQEIYVDLPWSMYREGRIERELAVAHDWWAHLLLHISLLHGVIPDAVLRFSPASLLTPAWSISLEWQFYLVAPLLVMTMHRGVRSMAITGGVLLATGIAAKLLMSGQYQFPSMLLLSIQFFLLGILSRFALERMGSIRLSPQILLPVVFLTALYTRSLELIVWAVFFVFAMFEGGLLGAPNRWFRLVLWGAGTNKLIRGLGKVSYSTYLVHIPVFVIVAHAYGVYASLDTQRDLQVAVLLAIGVVATVSPVLYALVERPFIVLGARLAGRGKAGDIGPVRPAGRSALPRLAARS